MRKLVLFVEGEGEADAAPTLVRRLVAGQGGGDCLLVDDKPFRVGSVGNLVKSDFLKWKKFLKACRTRSNVGGVLLILDGDTKAGGKVFCAAQTARTLAEQAKDVGAGVTFSIAVVFARQEYETWLIPWVASLAAQRLPDGRLIKPQAKSPEGDLEASPRDAKGWLDAMIEGGYRPTRDQSALTSMVDLGAIRARELRSFQRLESAVSRLLEAFRNGEHIVSPL